MSELFTLDHAAGTLAPINAESREFLYAARAVLRHQDSPVSVHGDDLPEDPLDRLETQMSNDQVLAAATALNDANRLVLEQVLTGLLTGTPVPVTQDMAWACAQAANGIYAKARADDLAREGQRFTPGEGVEVDVDAELAELLGHPAPAATKDHGLDLRQWSMTSRIMAVLSQEFVDLLST